MDTRLKFLVWSLVLSGVLLAAPTPVAHAASTIRVTPTGMTTWPCGDTWGNACALQTALTNAASGDEIWVAAGTYTPAATLTDRAASFQLKDGVAVYGGFAGTETLRTARDPVTHVTRLSGDLDANDGANFANNVENSYHVVTGATGATLDGVTIAGGNANGDIGCGDGCGGGMSNSFSNPTLIDVTFSGNSASGWGGGGMSNYYGNPTLTNVTFSGNTATYWFGGGGGMANFFASPTLTNVTFSGNSAFRQGGGMFNSSSSPTLTNVTFSGNTALAGVGGMFNAYSNLTIRNSIFWDDAGGEITDSAGTVSDSVVQDGYAGGTSIVEADPLLGSLGPYGGRTQTVPLLPGSSAIDGTSADCPAADQRGVLRPQGAGCDIGAYEYIGSPLTVATMNNRDARLTWVLHPGITYQVWRSTTTPYFTPGGSGAQVPTGLTCTPVGTR